MAETLYLKDGTVEVITGEPKHLLRDLIEERLGWDCDSRGPRGRISLHAAH